MNQLTHAAGGMQMSSSLKDRLKRCGRYHSSPRPLLPTAQPQNSPSSSPLGLTKAAASEDLYHGTPVRKRMSSSPLSGRAQKRQILMSADINTCLDSKNDELDSKSLSANSESSELNSLASNTDKVQNNLASASKSKSLLGDWLEERNMDSDRKHENKKPECKSSSSLEGTSTLVHTSKIPKLVTNSGDNDVRQRLLKDLQEKEETLRQLNMVKMYRSKNDLDQLQGLIDKWRSVVQQALPNLHEEMTGEIKPSLTQLIDHLGIEHRLIQYDPEEESFGL